MYIYRSIYISLYIYIYVYLYICTYLYLYMCIPISISTHTNTHTYTHKHTQELAEVRSAKESMRVTVERASQHTRDQVEGVQAELHKRDLQMEELRRKLHHVERELHQEVEGIYIYTHR
jgi:hypothetical protein